MTTYTTDLTNIAVHDSGWIELPTGARITKLPIWDNSLPIAAHNTAAQAREWLSGRGLRIATWQEMDLLNSASLHVAPVTLPTMAMLEVAGINSGSQDAINAFRAQGMSTLEWCMIHDEEVLRRLKDAGHDGEPVSNFGKHWVAGGIYGWWLAAGGMIQSLYTGHGDHHADYATTVHAVDDGGGTPDTEPADPPLWQDSRFSLGERCSHWSRAQMDAGVRERPLRSNTGPEIVEYFAPATRIIDGVERKLGLTRGHWCTAAACAATAASLLPGEVSPVGYRVSGIELIADAKKSGTWRPLQLVLDRLWTPEPGDICILKRGTSGWTTHTCRVLTTHAGGCCTVGANEGDRWNITERMYEAQILGFVEFPDAPRPALSDGAAARLVALHDAIGLGATSMEDALASLNESSEFA